MAFLPLRKYREYKQVVVGEFYSNIDELLTNEMVLQLDDYTQHHCYTRLKHSVDVAYFSFFVTRMLGWDCRSAARAGLLHDLFLYDWREQNCTGRQHLRNHPVVALENARAVCELNKVEENAIRRHMWLPTLVPPRYKEGFVVVLMDKFCAVKEFFTGFCRSGRKERFADAAKVL